MINYLNLILNVDIDINASKIGDSIDIKGSLTGGGIVIKGPKFDIT